jgi:hypothetical protein
VLGDDGFHTTVIGLETEKSAVVAGLASVSRSVDDRNRSDRSRPIGGRVR